ncbi:amino acid permease-associated region [Nitrosococcus halophilus Nc 4]|uniref:Amino acid permease-associated region n=1 Tax=Nitrosococcus halophilus (strain Nc4) TaxID=472759 RepID=D5BZD6_NITHN|nr:APC family permease [Nitrosococcus halophilus]ADE16150.1 amino acid permease-associated region [Nitrosococcus halophilus Nc 4]
MTNHSHQGSLKRTISLPLLTFYGLGNILGAGIYVLMGKVVGAAGYFAPLAFFLASLVATFTALSYAEFASRHPHSAGEAVYLYEGFQWRFLSVLVGLLIALAGMVSAATMAKGFAGYFQLFFDLSPGLIMPGLLLLLGGIALWSIRESVRLIAVITLLEAGGLVLLLWVSRGSLSTLPENLPKLLSLSQGENWQGIIAGAFLAFYAYIGFEDMVNVAEEVKQAPRNLPLGIFFALIASTILYASVALVAVLSIEPAVLGQSDAPLALLYTSATGASPTIISLIGMVAVINGALIQLIMASRILYGMSRQGWLPVFLGYIHPQTHTPWPATLLVTGLIILLALLFPLVTLAAITSGLILVVFSLVNLALWRVKRRTPHPPGARTFPLWVPIAGFCFSLGLLLAQLVSL